MLKPVEYRLKPRYFFSSTVTSPTRPNVQMKANASGTPAKFDATPENVIKVGRIHPGNLPCTAAHASSEPITAPPIEEAALTLKLIQYASITVGWSRSRKLASVKWPCESWNAPTIRKPVGRIRNSSANVKNGTTPIQASNDDARLGPLTRGVGVGTGGTSNSGCTDPASDEALIAHPWGILANAPGALRSSRAAARRGDKTSGFGS